MSCKVKNLTDAMEYSVALGCFFCAFYWMMIKPEVAWFILFMALVGMVGMCLYLKMARLAVVKLASLVI